MMENGLNEVERHFKFIEVGFKQSGTGREGGIFGLDEYLEPKAIIS